MPQTKEKDYPVGIGIDFGTSNSSVALFDGVEVELISLEAESETGGIMPTALYINRRKGHSIGKRAVADYLKGEAGRTVRLLKENTGTISVTVAGTESSPGPRADDGGITYTAHTHAFTDQGMKGRLFRSLKRWLGNPGIKNLLVFDEPKSMANLISLILTHLREGAESALGGSFPSVYIGRPVHFEGNSAETNQVALRRLQEACRMAGFQTTIIYPEPVAASLSFRQSQRSLSNQTILTFDFGGGTLDLCLMKTTGTAFEILAVHGTAIGGDEIDRLIYRYKIFPELGEGCFLPIEENTRPVRFPFHSFENGLLNWQLTCELNRPDLLGEIGQGIQFGGEIEKKLTRLKKLVQKNLSYVVFQAVERAKIELSEMDEAMIEVPEIDLSVKITRTEFEVFLSDTLKEVETCVRKVLEKGRITESEIGMVVCTGGSSKIPLVRAQLGKIIPQPLVEQRTFTSIAAGLAIASFYQYKSPLN